MGFRVTAPNPTNGYNRSTDWPVAAGAAARIDGMAVGVGGGMNLRSTVAPNGQSSGTWHPTIVWMFGFLVVELILFQTMSRFLKI